RLETLIDRFLTEGLFGYQSQRHTERAQSLAGERLVRSQNFCAPLVGQGPPLAADLFLRTAGKQDIGRALREREQARCALGVAMYRAHELAFGGERDFRDALEARAQDLVAETGFACSDDQCSLGRVTLNHPAPVPLLKHCVIRAISSSERSQELLAQRPLDGTAS